LVPLLGSDTGAFRLLSAVFGTAFVAAICWTGRELFDARVGFWSGAFATIAPMHIYYSQEARCYTLLTLETALAYTLLWRALQRNTWPRWILAGIPALAILYTHFFGIVALAPAGLMMALWSRVHNTRPPWPRIAGVALAILLLWAPWLLWAFAFKARTTAGVRWVEVLWNSLPPLQAIPKSLAVVLLGPQPGLIPSAMRLKQYTDLPFPFDLQLAGTLSLVGLVGLACVSWQDDRVAIRGLPPRKAALLVWALAPITILWAVSWIRPVYVIARYDQLAFPPMLLLLGLGLTKAQRLPRYGNRLASLLAILLLIPVSAKLALYYSSPGKVRHREIARVLDASVRKGDVIVLSYVQGYVVIPYLIQHGCGQVHLD
jgi:4-amino-4-deoxy-L-arabinose transferase-like glycosyltransferase